MMHIASIELYDLLKSKLGEKESKTLVTFIEQEVESKLDKKKEQFITLADKEKLLTKADALSLFATKEDLASETGLVRTEIANAKADLIKWMFIFIVGQTTVTIGVMIAVLQLFFK